jgi:hypothetical protein
MSQDVSLNNGDYKTIISWFDRLYAGGKEPDDTDKVVYQKIVVMAWAYSEERAEMEEHRGGHRP